jgi:phenylpropionate dioxygenase-like ring-hydroxylating dioxygenase large terminal subunit
MSYLRNAWYVAGFADELLPGQMLARTLLEEPIVFFRQPGGGIAALHDRCSHRFAPLSCGKLLDGVIQCGYHGLRFEGSGACVHNPHGTGALPKAAQLRSYPALERHGLIWWWGGDSAKADDRLIPDYSFAPAAPEHASIRGYMPTECNAQLLVDNILDLTHADFLHPNSLGSGAIARTHPQVTDLGERSMKVAWYSSGDIAPRAFSTTLPRPDAPTDQWTEVTWTAPGLMLLHVGATLVGEPREAGSDSVNLHLATPETPKRTHYWYWTTRNFAINLHANAEIRKLIEAAFGTEDKPMLEAQARRIGEREFWSMKPMLLPGDAGAVRARRKLAALIEAEKALART